MIITHTQKSINVVVLPIIPPFFCSFQKHLEVTLPSSRWCQKRTAQQPHPARHHPPMISWFHTRFEPHHNFLVFSASLTLVINKKPQVWSGLQPLSPLREGVKSLTAMCKWTAKDYIYLSPLSETWDGPGVVIIHQTSWLLKYLRRGTHVQDDLTVCWFRGSFLSHTNRMNTHHSDNKLLWRRASLPITCSPGFSLCKYLIS